MMDHLVMSRAPPILTYPTKLFNRLQHSTQAQDQHIFKLHFFAFKASLSSCAWSLSVFLFNGVLALASPSLQSLATECDLLVSISRSKYLASFLFQINYILVKVLIFSKSVNKNQKVCFPHDMMTALMTLGPKPPSSTCQTHAARSRRRRRDTPLHRVASTRSPQCLPSESNAAEHRRPNNAAILKVEEKEGLGPKPP
jgi:hypothetical protein